ncbi:dihydrofolate reductase [Neorhizobium sp. 2083]|uniref:hypothetical protein n=1 Tax=Neorhizobium sp. 2083 TaxID=2817762 RepID=UPI00285B60A6|nr:hypothetical protein [Neorhizobium sp. 2083]MDR6817496.1 dihydrofolate reductase [Neorhizobium sp. 2083]
MTKVAFNISMSLDGFITARNQTKEEPLGKNGEFLHEWFFNGGAYVQRLASNVGSVICGRKCYDDSIPYWDENGPTGRYSYRFSSSPTGRYSPRTVRESIMRPGQLPTR